MLDYFFLTYILLLLSYFLLSAKKELPLIIVFYNVVQYFFGLLMWNLQLGEHLAATLLGFLVTSSMLIIRARGLNYSQEIKMLRVFLILGQWTLVIGIGIYALLASPFTNSFFIDPVAMSNLNSIQPFIKLAGNFLIFVTSLQVILHWGRKWSLGFSLKSLSPLILYLIFMFVLRLASESWLGHPHI